MSKMYGVIDYQKETKGFLSLSDFTGTHGKHGLKTNKGSSTKQVKASRLVIDNDYLTKSAFVKEANRVAKELNVRLVTISYFNN